MPPTDLDEPALKPTAPVPAPAPTDPASLPPLQSPMPRSDVLDREEPEFVDEPDLPAPPPPAPKKAPPQSAAGEEDPGAGLDAP